MARKPIIGGNWKMHLNLQEALQLTSEVRNRLGSQRGVEVVIFPSFPYLHAVAERVSGSAVAVGGQDLHAQAKGAFTGAVAGEMLSSVGCSHVLIGHSERRAVFGDSDDAVAKKLHAALKAELKPVLCCGESLDERKASQTFAVVSRQLRSALQGLNAQQLQHLVIAYEPVWAIGTGLVASPEQAQEVHAYIRSEIRDLLGKEFAEALRLQYGGSVKASSAAGLMAQADIDGLLVGGASLQGEEFANIVRYKQNS